MTSETHRVLLVPSVMDAIGCGLPMIPVAGLPGGEHEADLVEPALLAALLGENQVRDVDRVERAAEDAQAHIPLRGASSQ